MNGLSVVLDRSARTPGHAVDGAAGIMPTALSIENKPYVPSVKVLARRDTIILYFPNVAGAADYRAYAYSSASGVTFADTSRGKQPRNAVVACAGYRQHYYESGTSGGNHTMELLQAIELPGFVNDGNYTIVLEAIKTPCPFTGMPAHTNATLTAQHTGTHYINGNLRAQFTSFDSMKAQYGNEIINGQGASVTWPNRVISQASRILDSLTNFVTNDPVVGLAVSPNSTTIPADPEVIARSAIAVQLPFFDESLNAPIFDVGSNAVWDDFSENITVAPSAITHNSEFHGAYAIAPLFKLSDRWTFWGRQIQHSDVDKNITPYKTTNVTGVQVFQRHGRMYTTFGDWNQDVAGNLQFSSLKTGAMQLDSQKYVHSFFRLNSEASHRRYWTWVMCGGETRDELVDTSNNPKIRPIVTQFAIQGGGDNPSAKIADSQPDTANRYNKECLLIAQEGRAENARSDGDRASSRLVAELFPAGTAKGMIPLGNSFTDKPVAGSSTYLGFRYKTDATGKYKGPLIEPFDQLQPLTHYDFFVRPDRIVAFINGRQGFCIDMSSRPLTMKYGLVVYGDLVYHSSLEWEEISNQKGGLYYHQLSMPIANTRIWDSIGESEKIDIPSQFSTFDSNACFKPDLTTIQMVNK